MEGRVLIRVPECRKRAFDRHSSANESLWTGMFRHQYFSILGCSCWWWKDWTGLSESELKERCEKPRTATGEAHRNRVLKARLRRIRLDIEQSRFRLKIAQLQTSVRMTAETHLLDFTVFETPSLQSTVLTWRVRNSSSSITEEPSWRKPLCGLRSEESVSLLVSSPKYIIIPRQSCESDFEVGESMYIAKVITWRNQCIEANKV